MLRLPAMANELCTPAKARVSPLVVKEAPGLPDGPPPVPEPDEAPVPESDEAADGETSTPTLRTTLCPLPSVAVICTISLLDCSVSVRLARTVFTCPIGPDMVRVGPLVGPLTMLPRLATARVPPFM